VLDHLYVFLLLSYSARKAQADRKRWLTALALDTSFRQEALVPIHNVDSRNCEPVVAVITPVH
jgi:hypothetical protein